MKVTEIEYGFTKNIGNFQNQRLTYRAILEPWEDPSQSLNELRNRVAAELDLPDQWHDLKGKFADRLAAFEAAETEAQAKLADIENRLRNKQAELAEAERAWGNFAEFLVAHGIDPSSLTVESFGVTRAEHSRLKCNFYPSRKPLNLSQKEKASKTIAIRRIGLLP